MAGAPAQSPAGVTTVFRISCLVVVVVAGLAGVVMVAAPEGTGRYFSWPMGPSPLVGLVGAFYLASAGLFALLAGRNDWLLARGVCFGVLAFTLPTLAATARHADLFDWGRWQAVTWVMLFVGSPLAFSSFLFLHRARHNPSSEALPALTRASLAVLATVYAVLALMLLLTPTWLQARSPFALSGLSGRFLGSWCAFLAVLALFALRRDRKNEAAIPLVALLAWPLAAVLAAVRSFGDLHPGSRRAVYVVMLIALAALAGAAQIRLFRPRESPDATPRQHRP